MNERAQERGLGFAQALLFVLFAAPFLHATILFNMRALGPSMRVFQGLPPQIFLALAVLNLLELALFVWMSRAVAGALARAGRLHWLHVRADTFLVLAAVAAVLLWLNLVQSNVVFIGRPCIANGWPFPSVRFPRYEIDTNPFSLLLGAMQANVLPCELILVACYLLWEHGPAALRGRVRPVRAEEKPVAPLVEESRAASPESENIPLPPEEALAPLFPSRRERVIGFLPLAGFLVLFWSGPFLFKPFAGIYEALAMEIPLPTRAVAFWTQVAYAEPIASAAVLSGLVFVYWGWISRDRTRMQVFRWIMLAAVLFGTVAFCYAIILPFTIINHCVVRGARVRTRKGSLPIEELAVGDEIVTLSPGGAEQPGRVTRIESARVTEFLRLTLAGGRMLCVTGQHPLATEDAWVRAEALREGDRVRTETGFAAIERIEKIIEGAEVYDLTVEPNPNFFAGGVLVHNALKKK